MSDQSNPPSDPKSGGRVSLFGQRAPAAANDKSAPPPPAPRRSRNSGLSRLSAFLSFVLIGAVIGIVAFGAALVEIRKAGPLMADKTVILAREDDGGPIAEQLERAGVIDSATWFTALTLFDGSRSSLKRGEYAFKAGVSLKQVEELLASGKVVLHSLTIPEGLTSEQILQRMKDNDVLVGDVKETPREGSLLPETYKFARGETRQALLAVMAKAQAKAVDEIWKKHAADLPIRSPGELVTLASIVEKETGKADERPRVAGVFVNRLSKHMKLQSDPTIVYGLAFGKGTLGHSITKAELDLATPYNTYSIEGLPPGPICNPGKAAMEAVANPARSKEFYFVADGTGGHAFAETLDQHLKNVAHWRQIEQDAKDRLAPDVPQPGAPATRGDIAPTDPKAFGLVAPVLVAPPALSNSAAPSALEKKMSKLADSLRKREALLGAGGALTAAKLAGKSVEDLGAVVTGVNDQPSVVSFVGDDAPTTGADVASAPMSAASLGDLRLREARFGEGAAGDTPASAAVAPVAPLAANVIHGRGFDASEGTSLDPLRNKTYDLSYGKTIPVLR